MIFHSKKAGAANCIRDAVSRGRVPSPLRCPPPAEPSLLRRLRRPLATAAVVKTHFSAHDSRPSDISDSRTSASGVGVRDGDGDELNLASSNRSISIPDALRAGSPPAVGSRSRRMFITLVGACVTLFWDRPNVGFVLVFYSLRSRGAPVRACCCRGTLSVPAVVLIDT